jgi:chromosomal replication initiation ATPase DnaA
MSGKDELVILFQQLHKVISKIGLQKFLARINDISLDEKDSFEKYLCDKIITICANHYLLEKNDFLLSKKRGNISEARRMCFALIKNNLNISDSSIGEYVGGRSKQFVNTELKSVVLDKEKIKTKYEHEFYENYVKLNNEVLMFKNSY